MIKSALSEERFASYRRHPGEPAEDTYSRYQWNALLCGHFYDPLGLLEVTLRNRFDNALAANLGNPFWLTTPPRWMRPREQEDLSNAHRFLIDRNRSVTQARIVQEMSFGFWTSLLNGYYETVFHKIGAAVFPGMPRSLRTRGNTSHRFEAIRSLRNRIFHFRRIWNRNDLKTDFDQILEAIDWLNPDIRRLLLADDCTEKFYATLSKRV